MEWVRKYPLCFYLVKAIEEEENNFFLKCLLEFPSETMGMSLSFVEGIIINFSNFYQFN